MDHALTGAQPMIPQRVEQRIEVGAHPLGQHRAEVVELEHVHVDVTGIPRDLLEPAELGPVTLELRLRKHGAQLALDGARPTDRNAEIVQELAVDVRNRALEIGLDHVEQTPQHNRRGGIGALVELE